MKDKQEHNVPLNMGWGGCGSCVGWGGPSFFLIGKGERDSFSSNKKEVKGIKSICNSKKTFS